MTDAKPHPSSDFEPGDLHFPMDVRIPSDVRYIERLVRIPHMPARKSPHSIAVTAHQLAIGCLLPRQRARGEHPVVRQRLTH